ncbi:MAG: S8 family peptidase [Promethearchaeota archaeon]
MKKSLFYGRNRRTIFILAIFLLPSIFLPNSLSFSENALGLPKDLQRKIANQNILPNLNPIQNPDQLNEQSPTNQKIEPYLIKIIEQPPHTSQIVKILILFYNMDRKTEFLTLLPEWTDTYNIFYDYRIIPALSLSLHLETLTFLIKNIESFVGIKQITQNHYTLLDQSSISQSFFENVNDEQWNPSMSMENWWLDAIGVEDFPYTGKGVKLAIMDTGVSVHPDFFTDGDPKDSRIIKSRNFTEEKGIQIANYTFDDYGHGTHCAGIAGGNGFISDGLYKGVAPEVSLINAKISNSSGYIEEDDVIAALEWCQEEGAQIISMSFGDSIPEVWDLEALAIKQTVEIGIVVVCAAGNSGPNYFTSGSPASALYSISVGASDINNHIASFSSQGPSYTGQLNPDVCAPGVNIISVDSFNSLISLRSQFKDVLIAENHQFSYVSLSGTSMACPMVAGAIALLLEAYPEASPETIRSSLIFGSSPMSLISPIGYGANQGAGLINVSKSLEYLSNIVAINGDINHQAYIVPRYLPYSPFDLLRFPGDIQVMNLSLLVGQSLDLELVIPEMEGISISTPQFLFSTGQHSIFSIPLEIEILPTAPIGNHIGYLSIVNEDDQTILDEVIVNITVANPKGKILFESFHGFQDVYPKNPASFSQIDLYPAFYDLYQLNYSLVYAMDNWTVDYSHQTNATLINPQKLAGVDLIVLQTPILPYSEYEVGILKEFYDEGGSILFLGTLYGKMCINSVNYLFQELGINISVQQENIFDYTDYGNFAQLNSKLINDLNSSSPIFRGVSQYKYNFGNTFEIGDGIDRFASFNNKTIIAGQLTSQVSHGSVLSISDFHFLTQSIYNHPDFYRDHSKLLQNIVTEMIPEKINKISITTTQKIVSDSQINFTLRAFSELDLPYLDLENNISLNASLSYGNGTTTKLDMLDPFERGIYSSSLNFTKEMASPYAFVFEVDVILNSINFSLNHRFFYYSDEFESYSNITTPESDINRIVGGTYQFSLIEPQDNVQFDPYVSIFGGSYLIQKPMDELHPEIPLNDSDPSFILSSLNFSNAGYGYTYCIAHDNESYLDLSPARVRFQVQNYSPVIISSQSSFAGLSFDSTQSDGFIYPINANFDVDYDLNVLTQDSASFEDIPSTLIVVATLYPIFIYNSYIVFLNPVWQPRYDLIYNPGNSFFEGSIKFPTSLKFSNLYTTQNQSLEGDSSVFFSLLWIAVRDSDGGLANYYILLTLTKATPNLLNYIPLLGLFGLLAVATVLLNYQKKSSNLT